MPLETGHNRQAIAHNVEVEIRAGKPQKQAVAIAEHEAEDDFLPGERRPNQRSQFYTVQKLGQSQHLTNEGFLLCKDVPIARTGTMIYSPEQTGLDAGRDGFVRIERDDATVFRPETLASFEGKPVTNDHPPEEVSPENYRDYVVGVCQNVRRGTGMQSDLLLADLLIQDKEAIAAVRDGKREVSCGYQADYEQTEPGHGRQLNIVGNHVALVDEGRCGSRCAIQDRRDDMSKKTSWLDRLKAAVTLDDKAQVAKAIQDAEEAMKQDGGEGGEPLQVHVHNYGNGKPNGEDEEEKPEGKGEKKEGEDEGEDDIKSLLKQILAKLEGKSSDEEGMGEGEEETDDESEEEEEKKKTGDKALKAAKATVQDLKSRIELLVPGFTVPKFITTDAKKFTDSVCGCKRKVLADAFAREEAKKVLAPLLNGVDLKKATADKVDTLFLASSELMRAKNNAEVSFVGHVHDEKPKSAPTPAQMNETHKKFWADQLQSA